MRLTVEEAGAAGREGAAVAAGAALFGGADATRAAGGAAEGLGGAGRAEDGGAPCGAAAPAVGAEPGEAGAPGPPAGKVCSLMVAVGLGGKLMRTVCFLGSAGLGALLGGGVAPGGLGLSAIAVPSESKVAYKQCQELGKGGNQMNGAADRWRSRCCTCSTSLRRMRNTSFSSSRRAGQWRT
jgi:hypothetical protein